MVSAGEGLDWGLVSAGEGLDWWVFAQVRAGLQGWSVQVRGWHPGLVTLDCGFTVLFLGIFSMIWPLSLGLVSVSGP